MAAISIAALGGTARAQESGVPVPVPRPTLGQIGLDQANALSTVNAYFNGIRTMQGHFIQVGPSQNELSEGHFVFARPGLLRLDYDPPSQVVMISNGVTLSVEDRGRRTQNFYALERTPLAPILAQYTDLTSEALVRDVMLDSPDYIVVVLAQADDGGWLSLYFDRETYALRQWVTIDARGNTITFIMTDVEVNQPVDAANFTITNAPINGN